MDYTKKIEKKLVKSKFSKYCMILLAALTVVLLVVGTMSGIAEKSNVKSIPFDALNSIEGQYCHFAVAALDGEYVAERGNEHWYTAFDENDFAYVLKLSNSTVKKLSYQIECFDDITLELKPQTVYGKAVEIPSELVDIYADVYGISTEEIETYFGYYYLDTTASAISDSSNMYIYFTFALFTGLFAIVFAVVYLPTQKKFKKCMKALSENWALETCANEIELMDSKVYLGSDYLYCSQTPFVVKYSDIKWIYQRVQRAYGIKVNTSLVINTLDCGELIVTVKDKDGLFDSIVNRVVEKNPQVLVGYDLEASKAFKQMQKENKIK